MAVARGAARASPAVLELFYTRLALSSHVVPKNAWCVPSRSFGRSSGARPATAGTSTATVPASGVLGCPVGRYAHVSCCYCRIQPAEAVNGNSDARLGTIRSTSTSEYNSDEDSDGQEDMRGPWNNWGGLSEARIEALVRRRPRKRGVDGLGRTRARRTEEDAWLAAGAYDAYGVEPSRIAEADRAPSQSRHLTEATEAAEPHGRAVRHATVKEDTDVIRVSTARVAAPQIDQFLRVYEDVVSEALKPQHGFRYAECFVDRGAQPTVVQSVTVFDSHASFDAATSDARYRAAMKKLGAFFEDTPEVVHFQLGARILPGST